MTCYTGRKPCVVGEEVGEPCYHCVTDTVCPEMALLHAPSPSSS